MSLIPQPNAYKSIPAAHIPPPAGYCGAFACLISPGGEALVNSAWPRGWAFAYPRANPALLTSTWFPIILNMEDFTGNTSRLAHLSKMQKTCRGFLKHVPWFWACLSVLLINTEFTLRNWELMTYMNWLVLFIESNLFWFRIWIKLRANDFNTFYDHVWSICYLKNFFSYYLTFQNR